MAVFTTNEAYMHLFKMHFYYCNYLKLRENLHVIVDLNEISVDLNIAARATKGIVKT